MVSMCLFVLQEKLAARLQPGQRQPRRQQQCSPYIRYGFKGAGFRVRDRSWLGRDPHSRGGATKF